MSFSEKSAWLMALLAAVVYGGYALTMFGRVTDGANVSELAYIAPMISASVTWIVGAIVIHVLIAILSPEDTDSDERDHKIHRFGEYLSQFAVVAGSIGALLMAMLEMDYFWIANTIYLALALATFLESLFKIFAYRRGLPAW